MNIKKHIPNAITCLNLLSGALAVIYILHEGDNTTAIWLIILAAIFDFFDGLVARWLSVISPIGKDLDSLADVVSFGLAPSVLLLHSLWEQDFTFWGAMPALLITAFSAMRLAKFNNDSRQSTSFIGLPVPANAFFWIGIAITLPQMTLMMGKELTTVVVYVLILLFSFFMVSEIPMFSFKGNKDDGKATNSQQSSRWIKLLLKPQSLLVCISIVSLLFLGLSGLSVIIVAYILLSVLYRTA